MRDLIKLFETKADIEITEERVPVEEDWLDREEPSMLPDLEARLRARMAQDIVNKGEKKMSDNLIPTTARPQLQKLYQKMVQQQHKGTQRVAEAQMTLKDLSDEELTERYRNSRVKEEGARTRFSRNRSVKNGEMYRKACKRTGELRTEMSLRNLPTR